MGKDRRLTNSGRGGWRPGYGGGKCHCAGYIGDIHGLQPFGQTYTIILIANRACSGG